MNDQELETEIDRLYQLPLDEFTSSRNALAKKAGSSRADIRALAKPSIPAWVVNQIYWRHRTVYDDLIEAAAKLRESYAELLAGRRADVKNAGKEHESALENALKRGVAVLAESGHAVTDATRQAIATTLRGLPGDENPGRLTQVLQPAGFDSLTGFAVTAPPQPKPPRPKTKPKTTADAAAVAAAQESLESAIRELRTKEQTAGRDQFEAARMAKEAEKAARAVDVARSELEAAQHSLERAQEQAGAALQKRDEAQVRAKESAAILAEARSRVAAAEHKLNSLRSGDSG